MRSIAEKQDAIGWTNFTEGRVTQRIRDMQTAYMCNRCVTYTVDHWMKDFIRKLLGLSHKNWLWRNLMKHHTTRGAAALKTKKELMGRLTNSASKASKTSTTASDECWTQILKALQ